MKLRIGQRVILPKLDGKMCDMKRTATVIEDYDHYYVVMCQRGYRECISKYGVSGVQVL